MTDNAAKAAAQLEDRLKLVSVDLELATLILGCATLAVTSADAERAELARRNLAEQMVGVYGGITELVQAIDLEARARRKLGEGPVGAASLDASGRLPAEAFEASLARLRHALSSASRVAEPELSEALGRMRRKPEPSGE